MVIIVSFFQMQGAQVVLQNASRHVQFDTDDQRGGGRFEVQNWYLWLGSLLRFFMCIKTFLDLVLINVTESSDLLLIGWTEGPVQLTTLFPSIPYGKVLPMTENSLL